MPIQVFQNLKDAIGNLNPEAIRSHTQRPVRLFLYAHTEEDYRRMEDFLAPDELSESKRAQVAHSIRRAAGGVSPSDAHDLEIFFHDSSRDAFSPLRNVFAYRPDDPDRLINDVLDHRPDLAIPLAMHILPFREEVSRRIIKKVARENALFALATAIPDIIPFISLPWAVGEFASDTAVLTANQIRMAFLLAAAADREMGYKEQKGEIASIVLSGFGWRALARELVGKIPMGGGLIPKAAVAYAGTRVMGLSLERLYRVGHAYTRDERRLAYEDAFERGKSVVGSLLDGLQRKREVET